MFQILTRSPILLGLAAACFFSPALAQRSDSLNDLQQDVARRMAATSMHSAPAVPVQETILAFKLRVRSESLTLLETRLIQAPLPTGRGIPQLEVSALAGTTVLHRYSIQDPRLAEIEGKGWERLEEVDSWFFAPPNERLEALELAPGEDAPVPEGEQEPARPLRVNVRPGLHALCAGFPTITDCFTAAAR